MTIAMPSSLDKMTRGPIEDGPESLEAAQIEILRLTKTLGLWTDLAERQMISLRQLRKTTQMALDSLLLDQNPSSGALQAIDLLSEERA